MVRQTRSDLAKPIDALLTINMQGLNGWKVNSKN